MAIFSLGDIVHLSLKSTIFTIVFLLYSLYNFGVRFKPRVYFSALGGVMFDRERHRVLANWFIRCVLHVGVLMFEQVRGRRGLAAKRVF